MLPQHFRQGQQFSVHLAVGCQRERFHFHKRRGYHVFGQGGPQVSFQRRRIHFTKGFHNIITHQLLCPAEFFDIGDCRGNAFVPGHHGFYLAQFNAESPQFDLVIDASHVLQFTFCIPSNQVTGTVQDPVIPGCCIGIGNKTFPG